MVLLQHWYCAETTAASAVLLDALRLFIDGAERALACRNMADEKAVAKLRMQEWVVKVALCAILVFLKHIVSFPPFSSPPHSISFDFLEWRLSYLSCWAHPVIR
jgi:hypothetical protein